jgi:hypothetical protein
MTKEFADFVEPGRRAGCIDNNPVSCFQLGKYFHLDGKQLQQQYNRTADAGPYQRLPAMGSKGTCRRLDV